MEPLLDQAFGESNGSKVGMYEVVDGWSWPADIVNMEGVDLLALPELEACVRIHLVSCTLFGIQVFDLCVIIKERRRCNTGAELLVQAN
jgi:hypothetical protein